MPSACKIGNAACVFDTAEEKIGTAEEVFGTPERFSGCAAVNFRTAEMNFGQRATVGPSAAQQLTLAPSMKER